MSLTMFELTFLHANGYSRCTPSFAVIPVPAGTTVCGTPFAEDRYKEKPTTILYRAPEDCMLVLSSQWVYYIQWSDQPRRIADTSKLGWMEIAAECGCIDEPDEHGNYKDKPDYMYNPNETTFVIHRGGMVLDAEYNGMPHGTAKWHATFAKNIYIYKPTDKTFSDKKNFVDVFDRVLYWKSDTDAQYERLFAHTHHHIYGKTYADAADARNNYNTGEVKHVAACAILNLPIVWQNNQRHKTHPQKPYLRQQICVPVIVKARNAHIFGTNSFIDVTTGVRRITAEVIITFAMNKTDYGHHGVLADPFTCHLNFGCTRPITKKPVMDVGTYSAFVKFPWSASTPGVEKPEPQEPTEKEVTEV